MIFKVVEEVGELEKTVQILMLPPSNGGLHIFLTVAIFFFPARQFRQGNYATGAVSHRMKD